MAYKTHRCSQQREEVRKRWRMTWPGQTQLSGFTEQLHDNPIVLTKSFSLVNATVWLTSLQWGGRSPNCLDWFPGRPRNHTWQCGNHWFTFARAALFYNHKLMWLLSVGCHNVNGNTCTCHCAHLSNNTGAWAITHPIVSARTTHWVNLEKPSTFFPWHFRMREAPTSVSPLVWVTLVSNATKSWYPDPLVARHVTICVHVMDTHLRYTI